MPFLIYIMSTSFTNRETSTKNLKLLQPTSLSVIPYELDDLQLQVSPIRPNRVSCDNIYKDVYVTYLYATTHIRCGGARCTVV